MPEGQQIRSNAGADGWKREPLPHSPDKEKTAGRALHRARLASCLEAYSLTTCGIRFMKAIAALQPVDLQPEAR